MSKSESYCVIKAMNFRKLAPEVKPLEIFASHIHTIGFDVEGVKTFSSQENMKNIIAFYLGIGAYRNSWTVQVDPRFTQPMGFIPK